MLRLTPIVASDRTFVPLQSRIQGIRVVELLVVGQTGRNQPGDDAAGEGTQGGGSRPNALPGAAMENKSLLKTFLSTMDLGWQAAVQPDGKPL